MAMAGALAGALHAALVAVGVLATVSDTPDTQAALERRVTAFSQQMRCLVCQNETLADSQAELAVDLRRTIRELMQAGKSDQEITAFLTDRYGDFVRYRPPLKPATYALWFGPFALLTGGLFVLLRALKAQRAGAADLCQPSTAARRRVKALLEGGQPR